MEFSFNPYLLKEWRSFIVGPDMPRHDRTDDRSLVMSGVYFLFDGDALVYVGQSCYIASRISQHRHAWRPFTTWGAVPVPGDLLTHVETAYIRTLRPPQNTMIPPPRDPTHERMVEAIDAAWRVSAKALPQRAALR